jgi:hypothetical protein
MKAAISILIVLFVIFLGFRLFDYWDKVSQEKEKQSRRSGTSQVDPRSLSGLPDKLESALEKATQDGPKALKEWLDRAKAAQQVKDPRLAWIELDYVLMVTKDNPVEAKRVFADVKNRTSPGSPIYPRVKQLEKTYE